MTLESLLALYRSDYISFNVQPSVSKTYTTGLWTLMGESSQSYLTGYSKVTIFNLPQIFHLFLHQLDEFFHQ